MTEYLRRLADEHGNDWPQAALTLLLWLHSAEAWACNDLANEYDAMLTWVKETIEAGVAFKQSAMEF